MFEIINTFEQDWTTSGEVLDLRLQLSRKEDTYSRNQKKLNNLEKSIEVLSDKICEAENSAFLKNTEKVLSFLNDCCLNRWLKHKNATKYLMVTEVTKVYQNWKSSFEIQIIYDMLCKSNSQVSFATGKVFKVEEYHDLHIMFDDYQAEELPETYVSYVVLSQYLINSNEY